MIAHMLGRHRSTISRELRRNGAKVGYRAEVAQTRYAQRRMACRPKSKLAYEPLRDYVMDMIALKDFSPELVAGR